MRPHGSEADLEMGELRLAEIGEGHHEQLPDTIAFRTIEQLPAVP